MKLIVAVMTAITLVLSAVAFAQGLKTPLSPGWSMLVVRTVGGSITITSHLTESECDYWAERLIPPPAAHREGYSVFSAECWK